MDFHAACKQADAREFWWTIGLCQLSSLVGATFLGGEASRSSSFQNTECDGCPTDVVKASYSGGDVLAHLRSRAEKISKFVVSAAISAC
jgi:hypothetical protein